MSLSAWAPLLFYPEQDYHARVRACAGAAASREMEDFERTIEGLPVEALQELYAQTFDWNPDTTLDIGWHLFGENYDRGDFLVKLRGALRTHGVGESRELPDHLSHVLVLLDRVPEDERAEFAAKYVVPALEKLCDGLTKTESPFLPLLIAVRREIAAVAREAVLPAGVPHE
ncbi:MAG: nitrate reductase molybdenum cofactor assembly chaperone [Bryobacterales bacterium]|nr:nitrate reductase molybdenum cofactor assembly chaperone [Bryobacterales bacterium]